MQWEIVLLLVLGLPFALCSGIRSGLARLMNNGATRLSAAQGADYNANRCASHHGVGLDTGQQESTE